MIDAIVIIVGVLLAEMQGRRGPCPRVRGRATGTRTAMTRCWDITWLWHSRGV
jgi:hypothetical protein